VTRHRVVGVELERPTGERIGATLVIPLQGDSGKPDDRDGVARIGGDDSA
jgi:hypothetical protein